MADVRWQGRPGILVGLLAASSLPTHNIYQTDPGVQWSVNLPMIPPEHLLQIPHFDKSALHRIIEFL